MCKNIVSITGHPKSGHIELAYKLSNNTDVGLVYPFTDNLADIYQEYHQVEKDTLDELINTREVLSITTINGYRYVFFKEQLVSDYNVLILDDYALADLKTKYKRLYSIKCWRHGQGDNDRVGVYLYNHEFSKVFEYDSEDVEDLEWEIEEYFMNNHDME